MHRSSRQTNFGFSDQTATLADPTATTSSQLLARLAEKKAELEHLQQMREASVRMVTYFEELGRGIEGLADGAQGAFWFAW
ncbi:hypothetical protein BC936DRAFT_147123 [Jimgerdemannia flammicorona]|uniref:Uncharacterized protein n=1 Tax=Jimgerdemannia flammicorona TaxID=994334 RepID=A0A433D630_9FUNG|nr:hypothetical protein BC936DRAFT_147123 [Jimgerdemannia flammicorona]